MEFNSGFKGLILQLYFVCSQNYDTVAAIFLAHILIYSVAEHKQRLPNYPLFEKHFCPSTLSLYLCPSSHDSLKMNCENQMFGNSVWHLCSQIYAFTSVEKPATAGYVVGISFPWKFN